MILVIIGTKAQLIKMAPVITRLIQNNLPYKFIWTGQHHETIDILLKAFNLPTPIPLIIEYREANTKTKLLKWLRLAWTALNKREDLFVGADVVLVHGDTVSTILAALIAKRKGVKVAHIEAGLRSGNIFDPFPEEIIRRLTSIVADIHYCPGEWAAKNLGARQNVVDTYANTLLDTLSAAIHQATLDETGSITKFGIVSMHRFENIGSDRRLSKIIASISKLTKYINIKFVLHPATRERLVATGLMDILTKTPNMTLSSRMDYPDFISMLCKANFLITDGGSNQEEASYLGIPCLLLRKHTERQEGLDSNVTLSKLDDRIILDFGKTNAKTNWPRKDISSSGPSDIIVRDLALRVKGRA